MVFVWDGRRRTAVLDAEPAAGGPINLRSLDGERAAA
jgi:hypothetical protein